MKQHTKMYLLSALIVLIAVTGLLVPSDGAGAVLAPIFFLLALIAAGAGIAGQYGSAKTKAWVEHNF
ncbi:MAG: hypothetical protein ACXW0T_07715 [Methylobacter sp.]